MKIVLTQSHYIWNFHPTDFRYIFIKPQKMR